MSAQIINILTLVAAFVAVLSTFFSTLMFGLTVAWIAPKVRKLWAY